MQSNGARALVALAGVAVIVVAFVAFSGGDDSDDGSETTTAATTTTEQQGEKLEKQKQKPEVPAAETIEVAGGEPVGGAAEVSYTKDDQVDLVIESDAEAEFHLHGYDIEEAAAPGKPAKFQFTADIEGKFELEDHHTGALIAELTVNP